MKRFMAAAVILALAAAMVSPAGAEPVVWLNTNNNGLWADGANWSTGVVPGTAYALEDVLFDDFSTGDVLDNFHSPDGPYAPYVNSMTFNRTGTLTISHDAGGVGYNLNNVTGAFTILNQNATVNMSPFGVEGTNVTFTVPQTSQFTLAPGYEGQSLAGMSVAQYGLGTVQWNMYNGTYGGSSWNIVDGGTLALGSSYGMLFNTMEGKGQLVLNNFNGNNAIFKTEGYAFTGQIVANAGGAASFDNSATGAPAAGVNLRLAGGNLNQNGPITFQGGTFAGTGSLNNTNGQTTTLEGVSLAPTGALAILGNVALAKNGSQNCTLAIGVRGASDYDQIVMNTNWVSADSGTTWGGYDIDGHLSGLENCNLALNFAPGVTPTGSELKIMVNPWGYQIEPTTQDPEPTVPSGTDFSASAGFANAPNLGGVGFFDNSKGPGRLISARVNYTLGDNTSTNPLVISRDSSVTVDNFAFAGMGDANKDGVVDDNDLGILLGAWGTGTDWTQGNFNTDTTVDDNDLGILLGAWGTVSGAAAPEPVTLSLLALGGVALLRRK